MARSLLPRVFGGSALDRGVEHPFLAMYREMNRLFDEALRGFGPFGAGEMSRAAMAPRMDIKENDKEICIIAEMPGVAEKDVEVTLSGDVLTIRGERKEEKKDERENYHLMERSYGAFSRSIELPYAVKPESVRASFEDGVLTLTLPKDAAQQRTQKIAIHGAGGGRRIDRAAAGDKPAAGAGETGEAQPSGGASS